MMPAKNKKPAEGLLIGLLSEKPSRRIEPSRRGYTEKSESESVESEAPEAEEGPDWELLGQEVLDAIEAKDAQGLSESMRALVSACREAEDDGE